MKDNISIYYDAEEGEGIKKMIDELMRIEDSPYFKRKSRNEIAKLILISALKKR